MSETTVEPSGSYLRVFKTSFLRYVVVEVWGVLLWSIVGALAGYAIGLEYAPWLALALLAGALGVVLRAAIRGSSRRVVIADDWVTGPTGAGGDETTIPFDTVDATATEITRRRVRITALGGRSIVLKKAWFAREDIDELARVLRDRCGIMARD
jgi:hypothetical protein